LTSTRDPGLRVSFKDAVLRNLPGQGGSGQDAGGERGAAGAGLFVPVDLRPWRDVDELLRLGWQERCTEILHRLLDDEYIRSELREIVAEAFDFPLPLLPLPPRAPGAGESAPGESAAVEPAVGESAVGESPADGGGSFVLELFHGPSLAFKDFGARFLAAVLARLPGPPRTILTATSGDTGAAVAAAFWRRPGCRVAVLYPAGRISPLQERQLACLGDNVLPFAIEGTFDDCQRLVKACFADAALAAELGLTSANSINVARLLAQLLYFFEAVAQLRRQQPDGRPPVIAVPSGNFGNLCAGLYARELGLPVTALVAATNANRTVPDYLDGGQYRPRPGVATLSNAMDVGDPSNWERIAHLYRRDWSSLRRALRWGSLDEPSTVAALRGLWGRGYPADPHTAVAYGVLEAVRRPGETGIVLATAHPAKFQSALAAIGLDLALPHQLAWLLDRPVVGERLPADEGRLKARLRGG
jgi:threonine synthase